MDRIPGFGPGDGGSIPSGLVMKIILKKLKTRSLTLICENLPYNLTLYEEKGTCKRENYSCKYYEPKQNLCNKQTYTPIKSDLKYLTV